MKIKRKNKVSLIAFLIITIILFTSFKSINVSAIDDNYSTYLYNQNINVDNDKAHLLSEQSDGSNSYRNILQSDFLFPAKLQSSMFSTSQTSSFSHYNFNQFYFDNLDNDYAFKSNNNSENFETSIISNDFNVINGNNIVNGSLENQDSEFGKYNTTYSFDDYQETESNYGNYNATYSFWNEIGLTDLDISFIDYQMRSNTEVITSINNHKSVIDADITTSESWGSFRHILTENENDKSNTLEFYMSVSDNTIRTYVSTYYGGNVEDIRLEFYSNSRFYFFDNTGIVDTGITYEINKFYHIRQSYDFNVGTWQLWIDGIQIEKAGNSTLRIASGKTFNPEITRFGSDVYSNCFIDGIGYISNSNYNLNDNTNPYGLQSELSQDFSSLRYKYGNSYYLKQSIDYNDISFIGIDNTTTERLEFYQGFNEYQDFGSVEFQYKTSNTNSYLVFQIHSTTSKLLRFYTGSGKFRYYDGSFHDIDNIFPNKNEWIMIKINFNKDNIYWNMTINGIYAEVSGNIDFTYHYSDNSQFTSFYMRTENANYNYKVEIDNLDYSWTNGYYENRINDLIPLNDSNYNMYKSEYSNQNFFRIVPDSDIDVNWLKTDYTYHYENVEIRENIADYVRYDEYVPDINERFSLNNTDVIGLKVKEIELEICYTSDGVGNTVYFQLLDNDDNEIIEVQEIELDYLMYTYKTIVIPNLNLNETEINNLEILFIGNTDNPSRITLNWIGLTCNYNQSKIVIETETIISYIENGIPVINTLYYTLSSDKNNYFNISIYNYDIENFFEIKNYQSYLEFNTYSFIFNESAYYRFNKFKLKIETLSNEISNLFIDKLSLNITYIIQNNNGYQEIIVYNHRYDDSDNYKGYSRFELLIYNDSIKYRYSEINFETDDYIYAWIEYNTSNIDVKNIELQSHCRFGLNTLDIEIINFYYIIYINYDVDNVIEFREQSRKELQTHKIKSSFNYTSYTRNYVDLTGIIGNYSYNTFKGCRSLYGATTEIFHRNFIIPFFSDDIDVSIPLILPDDSFSNPQEPEPPTPYYWEYETFRTEYYQEVPISIGNWTVQFSQMRSTTYKAKYFYSPNSITRDQLGSWKWKIKFTSSFSYTVDFNFMRNAVISIINLILLFIQWIMFLCVASLSYIFMYLGTTILVFLWNVLVYALFYALIYVIWYLYLGLYMLLTTIWEGLVWVYMNLLIPFFEWFWNEGIPIIIDWLIIILAHIITIIIYLITLGDVDYDTTYDTVYLMLRYIADEIIEAITVFVKHLDYILLFVLYYLLLLGLLYIRYIYVKARGFNNRAEQLKKAFDVFSMPVIWTIDLFRETKELVNPYS